MLVRLAACVALAVVLCGTAARADASCKVALEGDSAVVEQVRAELLAFTDDGSPCVTLSARCSRNGDGLEVEVHDAVGRSSSRAFAGPEGAAAFIVSWSLRPTHVGGAPPAVTAAVDPRTHDALHDRSWHPEVALGYLATTGVDRSWAALAPSVFKRLENLRLGGGLRALASSSTSGANIDLELVVGAVWELPAQWSFRGEVTGAKTLMTLTSREPGQDRYGGVGFRGGFRGVLAWRLDGPLGIEIGVGFDEVRIIGPDDDSFGHGPSIGYPHFDLGVRWVP